MELGRHVCRTKLPPKKAKKNSIQYERWGKNAKKDRKKRPEKSLKKVKPPPCCFKIFHRHFSENFAPPRIARHKRIFAPQRFAGFAKLTLRSISQKLWECSGTFRTPNHWYFLKSTAGTIGRRTAVQIGGVLRLLHSVTNGGRKAAQIGGVLPVLFGQVVRVGGS